MEMTDMPLSQDLPIMQRIQQIEAALAAAMCSQGLDVTRGAESYGYWELTIPSAVPGEDADVVLLHDLAREMEMLL